MKIFDEAFAGEVKTRLSRLPADATPQWGKMNPGQLIGHLNTVVRYTLGEGPDVPFRGNFKTRYIFRHVILLGLREIPHNVRAARPRGATEAQMFPETPVETLDETMTAYLDKAKEGALPARPHPFFGTLSGRQWQRFHRLHFIHHLKQFGVGGVL